MTMIILVLKCFSDIPRWDEQLCCKMAVLLTVVGAELQRGRALLPDMWTGGDAAERPVPSWLETSLLLAETMII